MGLPITNPGLKGKENQSAFGYLRRQVWTNPVLADVDRLKGAQATSASVITTVTTFLAQPDFARNITITPGGTTADVPAGDVTVTGTNIRGEVITEAITIAANATGLQSGVKAFKTVTNIHLPVRATSGDTLAVGVGDALGLDRCMQGDEVVMMTAAGVYEATRPTVVADNDEVEKNTVNPNSSLDGAVDFVAVFVSTEKTAKIGTTA